MKGCVELGPPQVAEQGLLSWWDLYPSYRSNLPISTLVSGRATGKISHHSQNILSLIAEYAAFNPHSLPSWARVPNDWDFLLQLCRVNFQSSACIKAGAVTGLWVLEEEPRGGLTASYKRGLTNPSIFSPTLHRHLHRSWVPKPFWGSAGGKKSLLLLGSTAVSLWSQVQFACLPATILWHLSFELSPLRPVCSHV